VATTIKIPVKFDITATNRFVRGIVGADGSPNDTKFTFDFSGLNFIDGSGYTVLSNTLEWLISREIECAFANFRNLQKPAISYLDDCGFFDRYVGTPLLASAWTRPTTLPCTAVAHAHAYGWLENTFSPWIADALDVSHGALASVRTCVKELFHNINDHSTQDTGFVHVQHYPNLKSVKITVSDFGTGIPNTIRGKFGAMNDGAAILHASKEGVTAKTKPNNMGAGLNYLIDRVMANQGSVQLLSLSGRLNCFCDRNGRPQRMATNGNGTYPGTLVDIALDTRLFVGDEEERMEVDW
jgi:hypothetical protein